jgi:hypothetical protein
MENVTPPKLFVSYSWSSSDHEAWVLDLANELAGAGIHVILDKWDLREGQEASEFMEKMISDPTVTKVIMLCDREYVAKANGRKGGVGVEAQIISAEVYRNVENTKFVAVVRERDEEGKPCVPIYYTSRIFIDLSDDARYASEFERLVRWAHDQPLHKRPPTGNKPAYLEREAQAINLGTSAEHRRTIDAIKSDRPYADPATADYLSMLADGIEQFRIQRNGDVPFDDQVISSIEDFLPYRNEAIELFSAVARYRDTADARRNVHRFLERLLPYQERPAAVSQFEDSDFDNLRFVVHELFLYTIAVLLKEERFDFVNEILTNPFYLPDGYDSSGTTTTSFDAFRHYAPSFDHRNQRLRLNKHSLRAFLLEQRSHSSGVSMQALMQADFILWLRDTVSRPPESFHWYPETLIYLSGHAGAFELFARAQSRAYFERLKATLGVESKDHLGQILTQFVRAPANLPRLGNHRLAPSRIMNFEQLCTRP